MSPKVLRTKKVYITIVVDNASQKNPNNLKSLEDNEFVSVYTSPVKPAKNLLQIIQINE